MPKQKTNKKSRQKTESASFGETLWSWTKTLVGAIIVVMIINGLAIASFVVPTGSMETTVMTGDFLFVNKFVFGPSTPQVIPFLNVPLPYVSFPGFRDPEKGDVIVFIFPGNRDQVEADAFQYYLKRCVGTAGDSLRIINDSLYVNGEKFTDYGFFNDDKPHWKEERWQTFPAGRGYSRDNYGPVRVPKEGDILDLNTSNFKEWEVFIKREGHEAAIIANKVHIDGTATDKYTVERDYCFGMGDNRDNSLDSRYWGFIPVEDVVGTPLLVYWSWDTGESMKNLGNKLKSVRWSRIGTLIK